MVSYSLCVDHILEKKNRLTSLMNWDCSSFTLILYG